mmetsp:Transcript_22996/g.55397  ORF Transcript_22996/g.55397 Transcript_22996/m.55397 type:complete len:120 (-) Transcript_22996:143-502(-)
MVITVWVQLLRGGENIGSADKITLEDDESDVDDLCKAVLKELEVKLKDVSTVDLNVSMTSESTEYLNPRRKLRELDLEETLFVHAPAPAAGSEHELEHALRLVSMFPAFCLPRPQLASL